MNLMVYVSCPEANFRRHGKEAFSVQGRTLCSSLRILRRRSDQRNSREPKLEHTLLVRHIIDVDYNPLYNKPAQLRNLKLADNMALNSQRHPGYLALEVPLSSQPLK